MQEDSLRWRKWHGFTSLFGALLFLFASMARFPFLEMYINTRAVSAWSFIIGSFSYILSDIGVFLYYRSKGCSHLQLSLNALLSLIASFAYLLGSIHYLPSLDLAWLGAFEFLGASTLVFGSQAWKLGRLMWRKDKKISEIIEQEETTLYIEGFAALGAVIYFVGTFLYYYSALNPNLYIRAITTYSLAGNIYFGSAIFLQKKYFFQSSPQTEYTRAQSAPLSTDL